MPYSTTNSSLRFLCPVKTCQRACKSKPGWTAHLRSVHPHLDFSTLSQSPIVNLSHHVQPLIQTPTNSRNDLASSPVVNYAHAESWSDVKMEDLASSPVVDHAHTESWSDVEMEDFTLDDANDFPSPHDSNVGNGDVDYHPVMNGKCLFNDQVNF